MFSPKWLPVLALALTPGVLAQGDLCSNAVSISGLGSFPYDTTAATTSLFAGLGSCANGFDPEADGFFQWTAPAAGDYEFDTFGTSLDTVMALHSGVGCAATCIDFNDDTGLGFESRVSVSGVSAGDMFLIQIGGYDLVDAGAAVLHIASFVDPCFGLDDAFEDNDTCGMATPMTDGTSIGLFASKADKDHYAICVGDGNTVTVDVLFTALNGDIDTFLWDANDINCGSGDFGSTELADGFSLTDNESMTWTNTTGTDLDVIIEVNVWDDEDNPDCNVYDMVISGSGTCGNGTVDTVFCDPNSLNSTGAAAVLSGTVGSGIGSGLHLEITNGVPGQLAYILVGNEATVGIPVSNGLFCLVGTPTAQFFRYNVSGTNMNSIGGFDGAGVMINSFGTSTTGFGFDVPNTIPGSVPIVIMAGDTWHFQGWYRDTPAGVGASNFTNGISMTY